LAQAGVRPTIFDKKMLNDWYFVHQRADAHSIGARHPPFPLKNENPIYIKNTERLKTLSVFY